MSIGGVNVACSEHCGKSTELCLVDPSVRCLCPAVDFVGFDVPIMGSQKNAPNSLPHLALLEVE